MRIPLCHIGFEGDDPYVHNRPAPWLEPGWGVDATGLDVAEYASAPTAVGK